jgi:hypothetical protein
MRLSLLPAGDRFGGLLALLLEYVGEGGVGVGLRAGQADVFLVAIPERPPEGLEWQDSNLRPSAEKEPDVSHLPQS